MTFVTQDNYDFQITFLQLFNEYPPVCPANDFDPCHKDYFDQDGFMNKLILYHHYGIV